MIWIVTSDVAGDEGERAARLQYIKNVTGDKNISWNKCLFPYVNFDFYYCVTNDGINGIFITGHINKVICFCYIKHIVTHNFVVANTCVIRKNEDKKILKDMRSIDTNACLYYAKQTLEHIPTVFPIYSAYIKDVGNFGFKTSKSERLLYQHRNQGLMKAIERGFNLVTLEDAGEVFANEKT